MIGGNSLPPGPVSDLAAAWRPCAELIVLAGADPALAVALPGNSDIRGVRDVLRAGAAGLSAVVETIKSRGALPADYVFASLPRAVLPAVMRPAAPLLSLQTADQSNATIDTGTCVFSGSGHPGAEVILLAAEPEGDEAEIGLGLIDAEGRFQIAAVLADGKYRVTARAMLSGEPLLSPHSDPIDICVRRRQVSVAAELVMRGSAAIGVRVSFDRALDPAVLIDGAIFLRSSRFGEVLTTVQPGPEPQVAMLLPTAPLPPQDRIDVVTRGLSAADGTPLPRIMATVQTPAGANISVDAVEWPDDESTLSALEERITNLAIHGQNFHVGTRVDASPLVILSQRVVDGTRIDCELAAIQPGRHDVVVYDWFGQCRLPGRLAVAAPPGNLLLNREHVSTDAITRFVYLRPEEIVWNVKLSFEPVAPAPAFSPADGEAAPAELPAVRAAPLPGGGQVLSFEIPQAVAIEAATLQRRPMLISSDDSDNPAAVARRAPNSG